MISGERGTTFVYQDANWNVIGLTAPAGHLVEEYHYTPYGRMVATTHSAFGDATGDGDVDAADNTAFTAAQNTYNRNFDADFDGDIDSFDQAAFTANYNAAAPSVVVPNRFLSPNDNPYTFTGRRLDGATSLMHYRARAYHPQLKNFMQRDPIAFSPGKSPSFAWDAHYLDGPNLNSYALGNPANTLDPMGLWCDVRYECKLVGQRFEKKGDRRICSYRCVATSWQTKATGGVSCEGSDWPRTITEEVTHNAPWLAIGTKGPARCKKTIRTARIFYWESDYPTRDCSRRECRKDCDTAEAVCVYGAKKLKDPCSRALAKAACKVFNESCVIACDSWCRNP